MVRVLLALLLGLPMLMPPGVCVCRATACAPAEASRPPCGCHRHKQARCPSVKPERPPTDHHHHCPAVEPVVSKTALPTAAVDVPPVDAVEAIAPIVIVCRHFVSPPPIRSVASPPLYLTHCALVI